MPRGRRPDIFTAVRAQVARAVGLLEKEIHQRQADLARMVEQAESWRALLGGGPARRGPRRPAKTAGRKPGARRGGQRVSWDEVLASVPKVFGIKDVLEHSGAASKGRAQIYPAFTRWEAAGHIKRVSKGQYEKVGATDARAKPARGKSAKK